MPLNCPLCDRVNPDEALYCCHDGAALGGARADGPIAVGVQPFPCPFVFPSGRFCRNFDELVLACETHWDEARDLLREGLLEGFLSGLGRSDLSWAARHNANSTDLDVGLDDLLGQLPGGVRKPARLVVQPAEINCGRVDRSADHRFAIHLLNEGMGLIRGSIASTGAEWLVLGDDAGAPDKVFQFRSDQEITVRVIGQRLRAGFRPPDGRLVVESNGGSAVVVVRVEAPAVVPFAHGVLAGADSPRRLAEKTRLAPREAAVFFENGDVAAWYALNGWTYPVQGPPASGVAALQQFYEAVGLAVPPRVEVDRLSVRLQGAPGTSLETAVVLQTYERRAVFAHAATAAPWLKAERAILAGRTARIPVRVPEVPDQPGEILHGRLLVTANGNQRFAVDVALAVTAALARPTPVQPAAHVAANGNRVARSRREPMDWRGDGPDRRKRGGPGLVAWILVGSFFVLALLITLAVVAFVVMTPSGHAAAPVGQAPAAAPVDGAAATKTGNNPPKDSAATPSAPPPARPAAAGALDFAKILQTGDASERLAALKKLAALGAGAQPATAAVCDALKDADPAVKRQAAEVLGGLGPAGRDAARRPLLASLDDADVCAAAAAALAKLGPATKADCDDVLNLLLHGKIETARRYAVDSLRDIGPGAADVAAFLRDVADSDPSADMRRRALAAVLAVAPD
ncbi:MAG TPA: hypothetical protein VMS17_29690, partial [Gemmataceae bacterium]|nr:hypothetical protein [Gemmataceae bacterium]